MSGLRYRNGQRYSYFGYCAGEEHYFEAAMCFFRAQKVYPSPVELIMIYQKTVPEPVFQLVVGMMTLEVGFR